MAASEQDLVGAWRLERWDITYDDGRAATFPFGQDAIGLLMYTPDGQMSASISRTGRGRIANPSMRHAPTGEKAAAFESYFSYAGRFSVCGGTVVHHVSVALNQNFVGSDQVRDMRLEGDTLTLSASDLLPGTTVTRLHRLLWRKVVA
jgi:hypothetical protein